MQLKGKILIVLVSVLLTVTLTYYLVFRQVILESFIELDRMEAQEDAFRCTAAFSREMRLLSRFVHDWAAWDDTYAFVQDGNQDFVSSNITDDVFNTQKLNLIHIYNPEGKLVAGKAFDIAAGREIPLDLSRELKPGTFASLIDQRDENKSTTGFIQTRYGPMMISSNPILTSAERGPSRGAIMMGRFVNRSFVEVISDQVDVKLAALPASHTAGSGVHPGASSQGFGKAVMKSEESFVFNAFIPMYDIAGDPVLVLKASIPRNIWKKGFRAYQYGLIFILVSSIALLLTMGSLLRVLVLKPISELTGDILSTGEGSIEVKERFTARKDEIGTLSREFQAMIKRLAEREQKIWLNERRLRQIIDLVPHFIFAKDEGGRYILANKALADVFGCPVKEIIGRLDRDLVLIEEEAGKFRSQDIEVLKSGKTLLISEETLTDSRGNVRILQTTKMPFAFSGTSTPSVLGVSVDITDIKRTEKALKDSESRLSNLIDFLPDPTFAVDLEGRVIVWNRAIEEMTGIRKNDILGKGGYAHALPFYGQARPVLLDYLLSPDAKMLREYSLIDEVGDKIFVEAFAPNLYGGIGSHLWAIAAKLYDSAGNETGAIECIRDITGRKEREDLLLRQGAIIEQSLDGIAILDFSGTIQYANPSWEIMHGFAPGENQGKSGSIYHTDKQLREEVLPLVKHVRDHGGITAKVNHVRKDGTEFTTLMTSFSLRDQQDNPTAMVSIARDISDEIRMEEQLHQSQKMQVIGQLAGGVAHDLNNMLAPILGYAEMLLQTRKETDPDYSALFQILTAADRARRLTRQLLAFGSKQVLDIKTVSLNEAIESYYRMIRRTIREDIDIRIVACEESPGVQIDIAQMGQILLNLALNAQDAISGSGTITIETSIACLDEAYASAHQGVSPGEYVLLSFSDTGSGMGRETVKHIFEPFFTTKERGKGTGLGLATVYGIVAQHKGRIMVYSEPGMGTTFKIYLPKAAGKIEKVAGAPRVEKGKTGRETIAVAEDDEGVRALVCEILAKHGYTIITAENTKEFIHAVERHSGPINLMLTDVVMPGLNGKQLFESIRSGHPEMKVLFMSGYTNNVIAHHGILDKNVHFIQKPFSVSTLTEKVRSMLDES